MPVVLWEENGDGGVVVELEEKRQQNFRSFKALREAKTVGEIRQAEYARGHGRSLRATSRTSPGTERTTAKKTPSSPTTTRGTTTRFPRW